MYTRAAAVKNRRVFVNEKTDGENGERPETGNGNEESCRKKLQQGDQNLSTSSLIRPSYTCYGRDSNFVGGGLFRIKLYTEFLKLFSQMKKTH